MVGDGSYDDDADDYDGGGDRVDQHKVQTTGASHFIVGYWSSELYFKNSVKILLPVIVAQA